MVTKEHPKTFTEVSKAIKQPKINIQKLKYRIKDYIQSKVDDYKQLQPIKNIKIFLKIVQNVMKLRFHILKIVMSILTLQNLVWK